MENLSQIRWMLGAVLRECDKNLLPHTHPLILDVLNSFTELSWEKQELCDPMQNYHQNYGKTYILLPVIYTFEHLLGPLKKPPSKIGMNGSQTIRT